MIVSYEPRKIKLVIEITPDEAKNLLEFFDKRREPSVDSKKLYSALVHISTMTFKEALKNTDVTSWLDSSLQTWQHIDGTRGPYPIPLTYKHSNGDLCVDTECAKSPENFLSH